MMYNDSNDNDDIEHVLKIYFSCNFVHASSQTNCSNYLPNNFYDVPIQSLLFVCIIIIIIVITINNFITILLLLYYGYGPAKSDTNKVARVYSQWRT